MNLYALNFYGFQRTKINFYGFFPSPIHFNLPKLLQLVPSTEINVCTYIFNSFSLSCIFCSRFLISFSRAFSQVKVFWSARPLRFSQSSRADRSETLDLGRCLYSNFHLCHSGFFKLGFVFVCFGCFSGT